MNKVHERKGNFKLSRTRAPVCIMLLSLLFFLVLPFIAKATVEEDKYQRRNMFYTQVINFTMPLVKVMSFNEDDLAENTFSIKGKILDFLGINPEDPIKIIRKEIAYIGNENEEEEAPKTASEEEPKSDIEPINPFKLGEKDIALEPKTENTGANAQPSSESPANIALPFDDSKLKKTLNNENPEVLIYHTHTSESYAPGGDESSDQTKSVCAVGDMIASELENKYGIAVIHDKTFHDTYQYAGSYGRSGKTLQKYLDKYKDFKLIIDLHRDSISNKQAVTASFNNDSLARIMFVMSQNHKNASKNIQVAKNLIDISQKLFPGFVRQGNEKDYGIYYYKKSVFNQSKSTNAVLIEVGSQVNTTDEAKNSGKYIARVLAEYINGKK